MVIKMYANSIIFTMLLRAGTLAIFTLLLIGDVVLCEKISDNYGFSHNVKVGLISASIIGCSVLIILGCWLYMSLPFEWRFTSDPEMQKMLMWYGDLA